MLRGYRWEGVSEEWVVWGCQTEGIFSHSWGCAQLLNAADRVLLKVSRNFQSYGELRTGEEINADKGELSLGLLSSFWKKQLGCQKAGLRVCITIAPFWFDCKLSVRHCRSNEFRCICTVKQGSAVGTYHPELSYREARKTRAANDTWMQNVCFLSSYRVQ